MNHAMVAIPLDVRLMNVTSMLLLLVFLALAFFSATWGLSRLPVFDIQGIAVSGDVTHNNAVTLRADVLPHLAGTIFSVDLARVREAFESVPWVRGAVVRRQFPNRLQVALQEHRAVAYWGDESESRLLNDFGEVFEANVGEVEQDLLPQLAGPQGQAAEVLAMYRVLVPLFEAVDVGVDAVELSSGGSWRVRLDTDATLELGRGGEKEISMRVQRFLATLDQVVTRYRRRIDSVESADLRHENGYAIRLRGVSTMALTAAKK